MSKIKSRMKIKTTWLLFLFMLSHQTIFPQQILTLGDCYEMTLNTNALSGEKEVYSEISRLNDAILATKRLPTVDAGASILYNSSVIDMKNVLGSLPFPGITDLIKPMPHEQYKLSLEINQVIFDGGTIRNSRMLEKAELGINQAQTESDLYRLKGQVNTCYFSLLLIDRQDELLNSYLDLIEKKITAMQSALLNDMITRNDIDVMIFEKIKLEQQIRENRVLRNSFLKILSELTGHQIGQSTMFTVPVVRALVSDDLSRPELDLFDRRVEQLSAGMKVIESRRMPKAFGFATLGYGNPPGNNFFKDEFAPYFIVGASLKWNIYDWNGTANEKQAMVLRRNILKNRKEDMKDGLRRQLEAKNAEIENLESLIATDTILINLRKKISVSAESQYNNGTITATEFLNQINSEKQAVINHEIHKINLAISRVEYMNIYGHDPE